jgi:uncharacterized membrane protein YeaQ/YmgE (transglycosylase-associated protein family)
MTAQAPVNWTPMIIGFTAGMISRLLALRIGRTHYPGFPSGWVSQLALGVIASLIGAAIIVALKGKEFTAATFLTLAATQFRDVRNTERKTLEAEERLIIVERGSGYIEGLALTYEARNYVAMLVALATSVVAEVGGPVWGAVSGAVFIATGELIMRGPTVGRFLEVREVPLRFEKQSLLYAGDVMMMEVGLAHSRQRWLERGVGLELVPKNPRGQAVLWSIAQRQAIAHEAAAAVGAQKDIGYPEQSPLVRMEMPQASGKAALAIIPIDRDVKKLVRAVEGTPVLELNKWSKMASPVLLKERQGNAEPPASRAAGQE